MNACLVMLMQVCLFDPSSVYMRGEISAQVAGDFSYWVAGRNYEGATVGRLELGVYVPATRNLTFRYGVEHSSLIDTSGDRGEERAFVGFEWRPFR
jgi:hypothetical protein